MFNQISIRSRVKAAINQKLKEAEETHRLKCIEIDKGAEERKNMHADEMVQEILGKIM